MKLHWAVTTYRSQEPILNENIAVAKLNANIKSFNVSTRTNPGHSVPFRFVSRFIHSMVFHRTFVGNNIWRNRDTEERRRQLFIICSRSLKTESKMDETWNVKLLSVEIGLRVGMPWTGKSEYILHFLLFYLYYFSFVLAVQFQIQEYYRKIVSKHFFLRKWL